MLVSGRGSNLQALLRTLHGRRAVGRRVEIVLVVSSRAGVPALSRARRAGVDAVVMDPRRWRSSRGYFQELLTLLRDRRIEMVCLAGWLVRLSPAVVRAFRGRMLSIHPSLLPLFGGAGMYGRRVHEAVLHSGMKVSGCTVHLVNERYDAGPILVQRSVPVKPGDTPQSLARRVLREEHRAYPEAVRMVLRPAPRHHFKHTSDPDG